MVHVCSTFGQHQCSICTSTFVESTLKKIQQRRKTIFDNNFPRVTDLEKSEIFRECFNLGRGSITADVMYTVLVENNFFIRFLKLKSQMPIPLKLDKKKNPLKVLKKNIRP